MKGQRWGRPDKIEAAESITISVVITNAGGREGNCEVICRIDGVEEARKEIDIAPGGEQKVSFTVSKDNPGVYTVDVNGLAGSFTVEEKPAHMPPSAMVPAPAPAAPTLTDNP
jgi:hypothetical protein